jgi:hypothetical protein
MTLTCKSIAAVAYSNCLDVGHNAFEFVLNFRQLYEGDDSAVVPIRIVTAPVYAKAMLETLRTSIARFEAAHGPIPILSESDHE